MVKEVAVMTNKKNPWKLVSLVLAVLLLFVVFRGSGGETTGAFIEDVEDVDVVDVVDDVDVDDVFESVDMLLTVLTSNDCEDCETAEIIETSEFIFQGIEVKTVYFESEEGKAMVEKYDLEMLPSYIFSLSIEESMNWAENPGLQTLFEKKGDAYKLADDAAEAVMYINPEKQAEKEAEKELIVEELKEFNKCLAENGFVIYGAHWCGFCKQIVDYLGGSEAVEPIYIECTEEEELCKEEGITGYPTIKIDGEGVQIQRTVKAFSEATGCEISDLLSSY